MSGFVAAAHHARRSAAAAPRVRSVSRGPAGAEDWLVLQHTVGNHAVGQLVRSWSTSDGAVHRPIQRVIETGKLNIVGEQHDQSEPRRDREQKMLQAVYNFTSNQYWTESEFSFGNPVTYGDSPALRMAASAAELLRRTSRLSGTVESDRNAQFPEDLEERDCQDVIKKLVTMLEELEEFEIDLESHSRSAEHVNDPFLKQEGARYVQKLRRALKESIDKLKGTAAQFKPSQYVDNLDDLSVTLKLLDVHISRFLRMADYPVSATQRGEEIGEKTTVDRSMHMLKAAQKAANQKLTGVWKIGERHVADLLAASKVTFDPVTVTTKEDFNTEFASYSNR